MFELLLVFHTVVVYKQLQLLHYQNFCHKLSPIADVLRYILQVFLHNYWNHLSVIQHHYRQ